MRSEPNPWGIPGYTADSYGESFADVYDEWYADLPDHDFIGSVAASLPDRPARVLELGVGTGRLVAMLRSMRPHADTVVGVDSSESMLRIARARNLGDPVELLRTDFSVDLPAGPFDCVFVGYNTFFNLPDHESMRRCMELVAARLAPGALFHIDVVDPHGIDAGTSTSEISRPDGTIVRSITVHDPSAQRVTGRFVELVDGSLGRVREWSVRYATPEQLAAMAGSVGLVPAVDAVEVVGSGRDDASVRHVSAWRVAPVSF